MDISNSISEIGEQCYGCKLCEFVCPTNSITFITDLEGFWRPAVNDTCSNCGKCRSLCPALTSTTSAATSRFVYGGWNKDLNIHRSSSSGGIFSLLAEAMINQGGIVYGAAFDATFEVSHIRIVSVEGLVQLRGSKYVQSDLHVYQQIATDLKNNMILFSGTPCQVAAVRQLARKLTLSNNLICIDLACNGANSPLLFRLYRKFLEHEYNDQISFVNFRAFSSGTETRLIKQNLELRFTKGNVWNKSIYSDMWYPSFSLHYFVRKCCFECKYSSSYREGDITLADFWGVPAKYFNANGVSAILCNSPVGVKFLETITSKVQLFQTTFDVVSKKNPRLRTPMGNQKTWQRLGRKRINHCIAANDMQKLFYGVLRGGIVKRTLYEFKYYLDRFHYLFYSKFFASKKS